MENWVWLTQRQQGANANPPDPNADEVLRRFKVEYIEDRGSLASEFIDRVPECFRALVRSLEITDNADEEDIWVPPTCNVVCLVLNADNTQMLANLTFRDDGSLHGYYWSCEMRRAPAVDVHRVAAARGFRRPVSRSQGSLYYLACKSTQLVLRRGPRELQRLGESSVVEHAVDRAIRTIDGMPAALARAGRSLTTLLSGR
jgi:hypothetical protein